MGVRSLSPDWTRIWHCVVDRTTQVWDPSTEKQRAFNRGPSPYGTSMPGAPTEGSSLRASSTTAHLSVSAMTTSEGELRWCTKHRATCLYAAGQRPKP